MDKPDPSFYKQTTFHQMSFVPMDPALLPKTIGPYLVESLLHQSRTSLLYLGLHPDTREPLAIKVLSPTSMTHPEMISQFLKEAHIIALTNHPNIVKLYGEGKWENGLYISMEFIQGISLRQFIAQRSLTLRKSLELVLQTAYGLLHLHTHGVIHRDLKPENILITEGGEVKIIDFGIAQLFEERGEPADGVGKMIGTPSYMSPEQKENPLNISFASDIYSLGIITYELLVGKLSYGIVDLSIVPKGLQTILKKALAPNTKDRYQDVVDLIHSIAHYLKSGEWEKDRSNRDQLQEHLEMIKQASSLLLPAMQPDWPEIALSLAKRYSTTPRGLFLDFFHLPNTSFLLLLGKSTSTGLDGLIDTASLRGMCKALVEKTPVALDKPFDLKQLVDQLNHLLITTGNPTQFLFQALLLDPTREQLAYLPCGQSSLLHFDTNSESLRFLTAENPLLGKEEQSSFLEIVDNWEAKDLVLLHSLAPFASSPHDEEEQALFSELVKAHQTISMKSQAEAILKKVLPLLPNQQTLSHVLIEIQRSL